MTCPNLEAFLDEVTSERKRTGAVDWSTEGEQKTVVLGQKLGMQEVSILPEQLLILSATRCCVDLPSNQHGDGSPG